jgi:ABC-2 type transport system permease protein
VSAPLTSPTDAPLAPPAAAPVSQAVLAQTRAELTMTLRRGESLLVTVFIPTLLLILAMALNIVPAGAGRAIDFLLPGILAAAIMSTGMVSLGIATAYERYYGVLKRLGASPLPRWGLIAAKVLAVLAIEAGQIVLLALIGAVLYGWRPSGSLPMALVVVLLGTAAFAGLGLLMAGALRAEATLSVANGLYLLFLAIGGVVLPVSQLPDVLGIRFLASILPGAALSDALRSALGTQGVHAGSVLLLAVWAVIFLVAAALTFKWE